MSVQPIDLSTVYSQMDNVAKFNASQNQSAQVSNQLGINRATQDTLEKSKAVKETAADETDSAKVRKDGRNGSGADPRNNSSKNRKRGSEGEEKPSQWEFTDPALGHHIDITG